MGRFKDGVSVNYCPPPYCRLRIKAGPQRDQYVDVLILEAKLGRKLLPGHTVEHRDGDSLNVDPGNLIEVTQPVNVKLMHQRRKAARERFVAEVQSA